MKKITLILTLLLYAGLSNSFAGSLAIHNMTPCTFTLTGGLGTITDGSTGMVYGFNFGPVTLPPGPTNFSNVSLLPGFNTIAPPATQSSGCVYHTRMIGPGPVDFFVNQQTPFMSTNNPSCNGGNNYVMSWNLSGNGCDVAILIF
ncbi:hypothetical protein [Taibaiella chishuiensis]|uniref:Secreted protein n=1 Tax=Taibaiella chishuiensis TaxID=1434707 RepID=A0A2P8D7V1_9BACT|nr:hypothetical protein [Taibaiella chishuiensis]PSK93310.1 hypothetical protein B0I18_102280 [Taibaiella chishuiensis]